jgi:hypothetical protein
MAASGLAKGLPLLRRHRSRAEARLLGKANVIGTMLGARIRAGKVRRELVLTVLVAEKLADEEIAASERIPARLRVADTSIATDVVEAAHMVQQAAFPLGIGLTLHDGVEVGTLAAFARSALDVFGLTCAHVIEGVDHNPYTRSTVSVWSGKSYLPVGSSAMALAGGGAGLPGAYGFSDAALFTLHSAELRERALQGRPVAVANPLLGARVTAVATSGAKSGTIIGLEQDLGGELSDVVVRVDAPGSFRGDSGMLWRDAAGRAVAIHAKGEIQAPGIGSRLTAAMSAARAASGLGIQFVEG